MEDELVIANRGCQSSQKSEKMLSTPSYFDAPADSFNFKSRACLHHETLNGKMHHFKRMSDTFRHGRKKLSIEFKAIAIIVQLQMEKRE
eukprot:15348492-Ditylum_brightwellii.AAC.1